MKWAMLRQIAQQSTHLLLPRVLFRGSRAKWPLLAEAANSAERIAERSYYAEDVAAMVASGLMAVNLADRAGGEQNVGRAYSMLAVIANLSGLKGLARRYFETGQRIARQAGDIEGQLHIGYCQAIYYGGLGEWDRSSAAAREAIELGRRVGEHQEREIAEVILGHCQYTTGEIEVSARTCAGIRDSAHRRANIQHEAWGQAMFARSVMLLGRLDEAQSALDVNRRLHELQPDHIGEVTAHAVRTSLYLLRGDLELATESADLTYAMTCASPIVMYEMFRGLVAPAEVYLEVWQRARDGNPILAKRMKKTVADLCSRLRKTAFIFPMVSPFAYRLAGVAACLDADPARGRRLLEKAVATAARLGMKVDEAKAELDLVRHADLDPRERAAHRERARTLFRNTGCALYLHMMERT
jgi:tetratricopeptide (TPR) repeat protein